MNAVSENKHRLVVTHDSARLTRILAGVSAVLLVLAAGRWIQFSGPSEYFQGALGAGMTLLLAAALCFERSRLVVDAESGVVEWSRRRAFGTRCGQLPFSQVKGVVSERPIGDDSSMRRVVLHTDQGDVPVTMAYLPDHHDVALGLALKIRLMIGLDDAGTDVPEEVRKLVAGGRTIEAMRMLRKKRGVSLRDAQETVRRLR